MEAWRVIGGIAVLAFTGYIVYAGVKRERNVGRLLDEMSESLDLYRGEVRSAPWAADMIKVAQGVRQGIPVRVNFTPVVGEHQEESSTTVTLEWPVPVSSGVYMDRIMTLSEPVGLLARFPALAQPIISTSYRRIERPWFGRCYVHGSEEELARVFNPQVRALLDGLSVRLALVSFYDQTLQIQWFGLEEDPGVVERAFQIGIEVLSLLAPRR